jgi:hypothetical protein
MEYSKHLLVLILLLGLLYITTIYYYNEQRLYKNFLNGFWNNSDEDADIETILYLDNETNSGKLMVSKQGKLLSNIDLTYSLNDCSSNNNANKTYKVDFDTGDNIGKYSKLLTDGDICLDVYLNEGTLVIYNKANNDTIMSLFKDNVTNHTMNKYILSE